MAARMSNRRQLDEDGNRRRIKKEEEAEGQQRVRNICRDAYTINGRIALEANFRLATFVHSSYSIIMRYLFVMIVRMYRARAGILLFCSIFKLLIIFSILEEI